MRILIQTNTANIVKKEHKLLSLQDPLTTNSIMSKNNITHEKFAGFSPEELAQILEVEFVILGLVNIVNEGKYPNTAAEFLRLLKSNPYSWSIFHISIPAVSTFYHLISEKYRVSILTPEEFQL